MNRYLIYEVFILCGNRIFVKTIRTYLDQKFHLMFFFMMIFILMGGLFTSIDSMPEWAQIVTKLNPVSYLIDVMRMVILKGSGFADIQSQLLTIAAFAIVLNTWAVFNYKKTS